MGSWVWRLTPVTPAVKRLKQEDCFEFKVSLRYIVKIQANLDCRMRP